MPTYIPTTPTDITDDWLNDVLAEGGHLGSRRVVECSTAMIENQGLSSAMVRVNVEFDRPGSTLPTSLMVKMRPADDEVFDRYLNLGFYHREIGFYRDLTDPGLSVPLCYYAAEDSSGAFVLLLEDLGAQRAFEAEQDVEPALRQIAGLHAKWWGGEDLQQFDWLSVENRQSTMTARLEELRDHMALFASGPKRRVVPQRWPNSCRLGLQTITCFSISNRFHRSL